MRRSRETMNSLGRRLPGLSRRPYNPCFLHPDDLRALATYLQSLPAIHNEVRAADGGD